MATKRKNSGSKKEYAKANPNPDYILDIVEDPDGDDDQIIGSAWLKTSQSGKKYISMSINLRGTGNHEITVKDGDCLNLIIFGTDPDKRKSKNSPTHIVKISQPQDSGYSGFDDDEEEDSGW